MDATQLWSCNSFHGLYSICIISWNSFIHIQNNTNTKSQILTRSNPTRIVYFSQYCALPGCFAYSLISLSSLSVRSLQTRDLELQPICLDKPLDSSLISLQNSPLVHLLHHRRTRSLKRVHSRQLLHLRPFSSTRTPASSVKELQAKMAPSTPSKPSNTALRW